MAKVDVKKLKKMLTLSHYDIILRELGIPIFSKSNTGVAIRVIDIRIRLTAVQVSSFTLTLRYSKGILLGAHTTALA